MLFGCPWAQNWHFQSITYNDCKLLSLAVIAIKQSLRGLPYRGFFCLFFNGLYLFDNFQHFHLPVFYKNVSKMGVNNFVHPHFWVAYLFSFSTDIYCLSGKIKFNLRLLTVPRLVCVIWNLELQIYRLYTFLEV